MPTEDELTPKTVYLELNADPAQNREVLQLIINALRGPDGRAPSREIALAITKLQEARFLLGEAMFNKP